ncbi:MAG: hypothetical protein KIT31_42090, partial [Deltaproteobacteria bacterium]|nr:hypothetical protein [Deltaproteobacteria bacterium]
MADMRASSGWWAATARLTGLLLTVGVATSRAGLLVHELLGHGAVALALGGSITNVKLFWFAGGWVRTSVEPAPFAQHATLLGGIAVELVVGIALWIALARRTSLAARIARALGATLAAHGFFYLAAGTFHGFGDGALLHRELGDARTPVALAAGALSCAAAF